MTRICVNCCTCSKLATDTPNSSGAGQAQWERNCKTNRRNWQHWINVCRVRSWYQYIPWCSTYIYILYTYSSTGIFFILPCIDSYARVDLRTRTYDVPPQEVSPTMAAATTHSLCVLLLLLSTHHSHTFTHTHTRSLQNTNKKYQTKCWKVKPKILTKKNNKKLFSFATSFSPRNTNCS